MSDMPPDFSNAKLDFSEFHDLFHWPFTAECRSQYGGWRHHLSLTWQYRRRDQLLTPWHWVMCKAGRHDFHNGWSRDSLDEELQPYRACHWCRVDDPDGLQDRHR